MVLARGWGDEYPPPKSADVGPGVSDVVAAFRSGLPIIVDHESGYLLAVRAAVASTGSLAALVREGSGLIFVAMQRQRLDQLGIPPMPCETDSLCPDAHVAVDAAEDIGTGISARDRAETIRRLGDPASGRHTFRRPGHVLPVAADLRFGASPSAAQYVLMLAALSADVLPVVAYTNLEVPGPGVPTAGSGVVPLAEHLGYEQISSRSLRRAYYMCSN